MIVITLSRRNLLTLLSKLDRKAAGEETVCALVKYVSMGQAALGIMIVAAEDSEVYKDREPGVVHPKDEPQ